MVENTLNTKEIISFDFYNRFAFKYVDTDIILEDFLWAVKESNFPVPLSYSKKTKTIFINSYLLQKLLEDTKDSLFAFFKLCPSVEFEISLKNMLALQMFLHELIHVEQEKTKKLFNNKFESKLFNLSDHLKEKYNMEWYLNYHDKLYNEYHADINGFYKLLFFLNFLTNNTKIQELTYFINKIVAIFIRKSYNFDSFIQTPIKTFEHLLISHLPQEYKTIIENTSNIFDDFNINKSFDDLLLGRKIRLYDIRNIRDIESGSIRTLNIFDYMYKN